MFSGDPFRVPKTTNPNRVGKKGRKPLVSKPHECLTPEEQQFELSDLYSANGKWSVEDKVAAATQYAITGNSKQAGKLTGIPPATIRWWKTESSWWPELLKEVRKAHAEELDGLQTNLIHKSAQELADRLENGDEVLDKNGEIRRKKLGGRDLVIIHGTLYDKRALSRGNPTSKVERSDYEALTQLAEQMAEFGRVQKKMQESGNFAKPIEGETIRESK